MPHSDPVPSLMHRTLRLASVDSTNAEAMRCAVAGETGPLWVVAETQSAGRGRSGRHWSSPPGNLNASLLVRLSTPSPKAYQLSLVAGVAVIDAIKATVSLPADAPLCLKWPNDILVGTAKAGGILVESTTGAAGLVAVIGIGINLAAHPDLPERPATHLGAHGIAPDPETLLAAIATALSAWLEVWAEGDGFAAIREAWLARCGALGQRLSINTGRETIEGSFCGVDHDGALLLQEGGRERRFSFGDVTLAFPASGQERG
jgi:BirA family transcriptional regulator, biotin operon repressor / biotin---[acetyl-CoA-carboxylase] ligase